MHSSATSDLPLIEEEEATNEVPPQLLAELQQFLAEGDAAGVRRIAHGLKSNGADFGATAFSNLCKELELMGKSGALDGAPDLSAQAATEYENVEAALTSVRREGRIST